MRVTGTLITLVGVALVGMHAQAGPVKEVSRNVSMEGAERLVVEGDFGAGSFRIRPRHIDNAAEIRLEYSPDEVRYDIDFDRRRDEGHLSLSCEQRDGHYGDDSENMWRIDLSDKYPTDLDLEVGAGDIDFDFGGIPITSMALKTGASSGDIDFSAPNPGRMKAMEVKIGAASLALHHLGNAHFDELRFTCGAASTDLDLTGQVSGESEVYIKVGMGALDVYLPKGIPVRVETDNGLFSSVDIDDLHLERIHKDVYESPDFSEAKDRMILHVKVGMGTVDFSRR